MAEIKGKIERDENGAFKLINYQFLVKDSLRSGGEGFMATDCERQQIAENKILAGYSFRRLGAGFQPSVKVMQANAFSASILNFQ